MTDNWFAPELAAGIDKLIADHDTPPNQRLTCQDALETIGFKAEAMFHFR